MDIAVHYIAVFIAVTIVLTMHEFSHAFVAVKCGDPTPKFNKRLSLNPLNHFDLPGLIMFVLVGFGWAKPVPINPYNFKNQRKGIILTSSAGVVMNYIMAFFFYPILLLVAKYLPMTNYLQKLIYEVVTYCYIYSLSFAVFNLLPFYPLDGFNLLDGLTRGRGKVVAFLRKYGYYILIGLVLESYLCDLLSSRIAVFGYLDVLGYVLSFARNILGFPIYKFWDLIFGLIL